ncbi:MAG: hypothetical protein V1834_04705 [Candidatus Micrarchaeota archaeon]
MLVEFLRGLRAQKRLVSVSFKKVGALKDGIPSIDVETKDQLKKEEAENAVRGKGVSVPGNHFNEKTPKGFKTRFVNVTLSQDHVIEINRALKRGTDF